MSRAIVQVALPVPLRSLFAYGVPEGVTAEPGMRVQVSFGPRRLIGLVAEGPTEGLPAGDFLHATDPELLRKWVGLEEA